MAEVTITAEDVHAALRSQLQTEDFVVDAWKQKSLLEESGRLGYLGDHFKVVGKVRQPASAAPRDFSFFIKAVPVKEHMRKQVEGVGAFRKEALFYKLLARPITELVAEDRGPDFQRFVFPQCHHIKDDCLMLDDLSPWGFSGVTEREDLGIDRVRMVVRALGQFHAGSLALEERTGRSLVDQYPELDFETFFRDRTDSANASWHRASFKLAVGLVPHLDKYRGDAALVARIQAALPDVLDGMWPGMRAWPGTRNVMVHGDVWMNNLMFRRDAQGRAAEVSLVDFQLLRYTPPAHDLVMFVLFCTDRAFQEKHFEELTRLHWDTMAETLRRVGLDPDKVLPWSEFADSVKKMWKVGLIQMVLEHPIALAPSSLMTPVMEDPVRYRQHMLTDRTDAIIKLYHEDEYFRQRLTDTMERLIDGYILNDQAGDA